MTEAAEAKPELQISSEAAEALGRFVIVWGSVEHEIEAIITGMLITVPVFRSSITTGLTLDPKINMIMSALAIGGPHLMEKEKVGEYFAVLNRLRQLISAYRNLIFHSIVVPADEHGVLWAAKFAGGRAPHYRKIPVTVEYFNKAVEKIAACREDLRGMRDEVRRAFAHSETAFLRRASTKALQSELKHRELMAMSEDQWDNLLHNSK